MLRLSRGKRDATVSPHVSCLQRLLRRFLPWLYTYQAKRLLRRSTRASTLMVILHMKSY